MIIPTIVRFNRKPIELWHAIEQPPVVEIKGATSLWNASLDDAVRYGGPIAREAIKAMGIIHDRKHIVVDIKVHMLLKGMMPAIPGWHTDGAPRDEAKNPNGKGLPNLFAQEGDRRPNRYHLLVTGTGCLTEFVTHPVEIEIPSEPTESVYEELSTTIQRGVVDHSIRVQPIPSCTAVEFDWWDIHSGVVAKENEWRYLIRVCESDYSPPQTDLREIIRTQNQVYAPVNFGW